jgi:hypothetical protein
MVEHVDHRDVLEPRGHIRVVRGRVMRLVQADLREPAAARLALHHHGDDARRVTLEREGLQVEHQLRVIAVDGRRALRRLHGRRQIAVFLFRLDDAPLDLANRLEVLVDLAAIAVAQTPLQVGDINGHRVEKAAVRLDTGQALLGRGAFGIAEQPLEHFARVGLGRQRRRRRAVGQRRQIPAVGVLTVADHGQRLEAKLEGRHLVVLADLLRDELVHRDTGQDVGAAPGANVRQERAGGTRVADARVVEAADDGELILEWSQRLHDRREIEAGAGGLRRPVLHDHAHRHVDRAETRRRCGSRLGESGQRRHHAVKQR